MNSSVLLGPCMPQPTTPKVMRSEGGGEPSRPKAEAGMKVGNARAAPAAPDTLRKLRRLKRAAEGLPFVIVLPSCAALVPQNQRKNRNFISIFFEALRR